MIKFYDSKKFVEYAQCYFNHTLHSMLGKLLNLDH